MTDNLPARCAETITHDGYVIRCAAPVGHVGSHRSEALDTTRWDQLDGHIDLRITWRSDERKIAWMVRWADEDADAITMSALGKPDLVGRIASGEVRRELGTATEKWLADHAEHPHRITAWRTPDDRLDGNALLRWLVCEECNTDFRFVVGMK